MLNLRWSLLLGASLSSLVSFGCSSDPESTASGTGGKANTGGATGAMGGSKATGGGSATGGSSAMTEATADAIKALIMAGTFKAAPWKSDVAAPRVLKPGTGHGDASVRVWFNDTLQASAKAGNGLVFDNSVPPKQVAGPPQVTGSMAVKEFYKADAVVGHAVMLKKPGAYAEWAYYCDADKTLCGGTPSDNMATPFFGAGATVSPCGFCHAGNIYTPVPAP